MMTGKALPPLGWVLITALLLLSLLAASGSVVAVPGDLTVEMALEEDDLEARPEEEADTVVFHGNVTFTQPFYQYASADLTAELDRNWTVTVTPATVSNRGTGTKAFTVSVEVPTNARGREVAALEVAAAYSTRFGDIRTVTGSATVLVRAWVGYRINATGPMELVLAQGGSGLLSVPLLNVGNEPEYFSTGVPYWFGLRPLGLTVDTTSGPVLVQEKKEAVLEFTVTVAADAVPRAYVFDLLLDAQSLQAGGEGATEDPRRVEAVVYVTGRSPPDDPYEGWRTGDPPEKLPSWKNVFGSSELRHHPYVDASGTYVVYDQRVEGDSVIYLGEVTGSGARRLTHGHFDHHPVFSPNGQMIAFARVPDRIVIINHNGTELMEFGSELGNVNLTDWSPSSERLLFDAGGDIYELDLRNNITHLLAAEPVYQGGAVYSPDGGRIYYISYEAAGRKPEIWSMRSDGSRHTQLTFNDLVERSASVSPNGRRVAFTLEAANLLGDRVCVMDTDGSDVRSFTDRTRTIYLLRWLPDGKHLLAEVSLHNSTQHDIQRVQYPWKDAGSPDPGDGGDGGGPDGGAWDWLTGWIDLYLITGVILLTLIAVGALHLRRRRQQERSEAAEQLREMTRRTRTEVVQEEPEVVRGGKRFYW